MVGGDSPLLFQHGWHAHSRVLIGIDPFASTTVQEEYREELNGPDADNLSRAFDDPLEVIGQFLSAPHDCYWCFYYW